MNEKDSEGLQSIGRSITDKIDETLKSINGSAADECKIYLEEQSGSYIQSQALANEGKPIIFGGEYRVWYIKDHKNTRKSNFDNAVNDHPDGCYANGRRVHFIWCKTLVYMNASGRKARYTPQKLERDTQSIDLLGRQGVEAKLAWCQNCLKYISKEILKDVFPDHKKYPQTKITEYVSEHGKAEGIARCLKHYQSTDKQMQLQQKLWDAQNIPHDKRG